MTALIWRKSSTCASGSCVEVAYDGRRYLIRDSKNPHLPPLRFTEPAWQAFVAGIRAGDIRI